MGSLRETASALLLVYTARIAFADQWSCDASFRGGWAGQVSSSDLRLVTEGQCDLPPAFELARCFAGRWVHVLGDSTARLPLQAFTSELLGCQGAGDDASSSLLDATAKDHERCKTLTTYGTSFEGGPIHGFSTTFEPLKNVLAIKDTFWYREQVLSASAQTLPDAVVIADYLGDVVDPDTSKPVADLIVAYLSNFKKFLMALTRSPRWATYWSGRVYVRLVLPTERLFAWETLRGPNNPLAMPKINFVNRAIKAMIEEIAPGVIILAQDHLVRHLETPVDYQQPDFARTSLALTKDGVHFVPQVNSVLMKHVLMLVHDAIAARSGGYDTGLCGQYGTRSSRTTTATASPSASPVYIRRDPLTGEEIDLRGSRGNNGEDSSNADWLRTAADAQLLRERDQAEMILQGPSRPIAAVPGSDTFSLDSLDSNGALVDRDAASRAALADQWRAITREIAAAQSSGTVQSVQPAVPISLPGVPSQPSIIPPPVLPIVGVQAQVPGAPLSQPLQPSTQVTPLPPVFPLMQQQLQQQGTLQAQTTQILALQQQQAPQNVLPQTQQSAIQPQPPVAQSQQQQQQQQTAVQQQQVAAVPLSTTASSSAAPVTASQSPPPVVLTLSASPRPVRAIDREEVDATESFPNTADDGEARVQVKPPRRRPNPNSRGLRRSEASPSAAWLVMVRASLPSWIRGYVTASSLYAVSILAVGATWFGVQYLRGRVQRARRNDPRSANRRTPAHERQSPQRRVRTHLNASEATLPSDMESRMGVGGRSISSSETYRPPSVLSTSGRGRRGGGHRTGPRVTFADDVWDGSIDAEESARLESREYVDGPDNVWTNSVEQYDGDNRPRQQRQCRQPPPRHASIPSDSESKLKLPAHPISPSVMEAATAVAASILRTPSISGDGPHHTPTEASPSPPSPAPDNNAELQGASENAS